MKDKKHPATEGNGPLEVKVRYIHINPDGTKVEVERYEKDGLSYFRNMSNSTDMIVPNIDGLVNIKIDDDLSSLESFEIDCYYEEEVPLRLFSPTRSHSGSPLTAGKYTKVWPPYRVSMATNNEQLEWITLMVAKSMMANKLEFNPSVTYPKDPNKGIIPGLNIEP